MELLSDSISDIEYSILINHSILYIKTKNLLYYNEDDIKFIKIVNYTFNYNNISDFIENCIGLSNIFKNDKISKLCDRYPNIICKILFEFSKNSKYYRILNIDYMIITIYDSPFIIFENVKKCKNNKKEKKSGRSLILEISYLRYNIICYINDKNYINKNPIPHYFYRIYSKVVLNNNINI